MAENETDGPPPRAMLGSDPGELDQLAEWIGETLPELDGQDAHLIGGPAFLRNSGSGEPVQIHLHSPSRASQIRSDVLRRLERGLPRDDFRSLVRKYDPDARSAVVRDLKWMMQDALEVIERLKLPPHGEGQPGEVASETSVDREKKTRRPKAGRKRGTKKDGTRAIDLACTHIEENPHLVETITNSELAMMLGCSPSTFSNDEARTMLEKAKARARRGAIDPTRGHWDDGQQVDGRSEVDWSAIDEEIDSE